LYIAKAAILKIQDGCQLETIYLCTSEFLIYKNLIIDTKITSLCALKLIIEHFIYC